MSLSRGVSAALVHSRWFVPLGTAAAGADVVQLVALTDSTFAELSSIERGPGSADDKRRAMSVLVSQLVVATGLAALSVQGARNLRTMAGAPLEIIEQNGARLLRVVGDDATPPMQADEWLTKLEGRLDDEEAAKLARMPANKSPAEIRGILGEDLDAAHQRIQKEVQLASERAASTARSKERVVELKRAVVERGLLEDPEIRAIIDRIGSSKYDNVLSAFRDRLMSKILSTELASAARSTPGSEVIEGVKLYERTFEGNMQAWRERHPGKSTNGLTERDNGIYIDRGEIDLMLVQRRSPGKARIIAREEVKTGGRDTHADARAQLDAETALLQGGAEGKIQLRLELGKRDITSEIDLASDAAARKSTRGPAGKSFDQSLDITAADLEALCRELLPTKPTPGGESR